MWRMRLTRDRPPACLSIRRWEAAPGCSTRLPAPPSAGTTPVVQSMRHRTGFQPQHLCGGRRTRPRACLSIRRGAAPGRRRPPRHHRREQHRPGIPTRHRAGFQRQHLCGGLLRRERVCLSALGSSTGRLNENPTATISGPDGLLTHAASRWIPAATSMWRDSGAASVFAYPALGSSTGPLNEFPTATISGPFTELAEPVFVALQPAAAPTPTPTATATGATPTATATATQTATPTATATPTDRAERGPDEAQLRQRRCDRDQQAQESGADQQGHDCGSDRNGDRDAAIRDRRRR